MNTKIAIKLARKIMNLGTRIMTFKKTTRVFLKDSSIVPPIVIVSAYQGGAFSRCLVYATDFAIEGDGLKLTISFNRLNP